ncbi:hypothetical protein BFP72_08440 [Reichenbachiella sp. 5M10]|uniref:BamA/TamA family outer membrane protein n=1 Tax=Reichenbachiella sp. 5M10 TaxID=1889772 RepID=UPI000C146CEE|nr:BamA/TamA family outer membrane protein [Reichenbachiella sp. 5M10]PIB35421.1 hypothetical protein BFP72_08440 [Reichenbachiella sp. 5M10]
MPVVLPFFTRFKFLIVRWMLSLCLVLPWASTPVQAQVKRAPKDSTKKVTFAAIPMPNYNRSFGFMLGVMGSMYYKVSPKDTLSPSSSTMLMGMYSTSKTYMALGVQQFYLREDRWRLKLVGGTGEIFFQYFQGLPNLPPPVGEVYDGGIWVDFTTNTQFLVLDARRRVLPKLYVGGLFNAQWATTVYDIENPLTGELPSKSANMMSVGYSMLYDSRDNVNYPTNGYFIQFKNSFIREALGATSDYNQYEIAANNFWDIKKNSNTILVSRIYANIADGDVPFQGQNFIGRDDLRGYSQGKYRGDQVYAIQAELRQHLYKRFGMVAFLGVGTAVDQLQDLSEAPVLPSVGAGLRYRMIPSEKINIGLDVGVGREDWSLTFRIGETFGR